MDSVGTLFDGDYKAEEVYSSEISIFMASLILGYFLGILFMLSGC